MPILPIIPPEVEILTEDDVIVGHGSRVYNYYDMCPGTIEIRQSQVDKIDNSTDIRQDIWFDFIPDGKTTSTIMNGARICTIEFAKRRGFRNAEGGEAK